MYVHLRPVDYVCFTCQHAKAMISVLHYSFRQVPSSLSLYLERTDLHSQTGVTIALKSSSKHAREEIERRACETNAIGNGRECQYEHQIPLGP